MRSMLLRASRDLVRTARKIASAGRWAAPVTVARSAPSDLGGRLSFHGGIDVTPPAPPTHPATNWHRPPPSPPTQTQVQTRRSCLQTRMSSLRKPCGPCTSAGASLST